MRGQIGPVRIYFDRYATPGGRFGDRAVNIGESSGRTDGKYHVEAATNFAFVGLRRRGRQTFPKKNDIGPHQAVAFVTPRRYCEQVEILDIKSCPTITTEQMS